MVSLNFQERFKNKISAISKLGLVAITNSKPITKNTLEKTSALKKSANSILGTNEVKRTSFIYNKYNRKDLNRSVTEVSSVLGRKNHYSESGIPHHFSRSIDPGTRLSKFERYTLSEYKNTRNYKYYELGKLGASGSDAWKAKKDALIKRIDYAERANCMNLNNKPLKRFKLFSGQGIPRNSYHN